MRQKGESQNGCFKKTKHAKFSEIWKFVSPWYAHARMYQRVRNICFSKNLILGIRKLEISVSEISVLGKVISQIKKDSS